MAHRRKAGREFERDMGGLQDVEGSGAFWKRDVSAS
jgi:hypothetical protein